MSMKKNFARVAVACIVVAGFLNATTLRADESERLRSGQVVNKLARVVTTLGFITESLRQMNLNHRSGDFVSVRERVCVSFNKELGARAFFFSKSGSDKPSTLDENLKALRKAYRKTQNRYSIERVEEIVALAAEPMFQIDSYCRGQQFLAQQINSHVTLDRAIDRAAMLLANASDVVKELLTEEKSRYESLVEPTENETRETKGFFETLFESAARALKPAALGSDVR